MQQVAEEASKNLALLKEVLCGTGDKEPQTEAVAQLAQELYNTNLFIALIANLQRIDFEVMFQFGFCFAIFGIFDVVLFGAFILFYFLNLVTTCMFLWFYYPAFHIMI